MAAFNSTLTESEAPDGSSGPAAPQSWRGPRIGDLPQDEAAERESVPVLAAEPQPHNAGLNGASCAGGNAEFETPDGARIVLALEAIDHAARNARTARALRIRQFKLEAERHELAELYDAREDQFWQEQSELFWEIQRLGSQIATFRQLAHKLETGEGWAHG